MTIARALRSGSRSPTPRPYQQSHMKCRRTKPFILYHWSPSCRRKSIKRHGLKVGSQHAIHSKGWRATYLCFSDSPSYAWALSGNTSRAPEEWDLWMTWSNRLSDLSYRFDHVGQMPAEYRTKVNVGKKDLWLVGSRMHAPKSKPTKQHQLKSQE